MSNWGILNKNPGNVRPTQPWEGMIGEAGGFAVFSTPVWGFRAMFKNYISYIDAGYNTITKIVNRWSPASDNTSASDPDGTKSVAAYIAALTKSTGFDADQPIAKVWDQLSKLGYAQTIHECGSFAPFTLTQMQQGAFRAGIMDAPPPIVRSIATKVAASGSAIAAGASAAQPVVQSWQQTQHSPSIQIGLGVLAAILAIVAAVVHPKVSSQ